VRRITKARAILNVAGILGRQEHDVTTTAWRFSGTEGADEAVLRLKQLEAAKLVEAQDITVIRWPQYAAEPPVREHVIEESGKVSSLVHKFTHSGIDSSMVQSAKGDMTPGTSVLVLLTPEAAVDAFAKAFEGQGVELIRSDLSVQEQDEVRAAPGFGCCGLASAAGQCPGEQAPRFREFSPGNRNQAPALP
jgi:uncharacterized membrane protein